MNLKVALVHDWLTNLGGGERVLLALHKAFPGAPIYTSVFNPRQLPQLRGLDVRTSFLQRWPLAKVRHQIYPLLRWRAFRSFDLSGYDVVISSASAEAKAIRTGSNPLHICYCHTPTRYYWSDYDKYRRQPGFGWLDPLLRQVLPTQIKKLRQWDYAAAQGVDYFIANSHYVATRIKKYYRRSSSVIYPPVELKHFRLNPSPRRGFLVVGRQVPYKRVDLAIAACNRLRLELTVVGNGSQHAKLRSLAGPTIKFITHADDKQVAKAYGQARALIFPAEEDFGLVPVEAMACGTPVIAYGAGGATESVLKNKTGIFFDKQTVVSLTQALKRFSKMQFKPAVIAHHARQFSQQRFIKEISSFVNRKLQASQSK